LRNENTKELCETTHQHLKKVADKLEDFLNSHTVALLNPEGNEEMTEFYKGYLSDFRHLLVFSEVSWEKIGVILRRPTFNIEQAEKVLYETYHSCVNLFFYPKFESYSEDGRYAYTGQDAIRFRKQPTREIRIVTVELSKLFEQLREELSYYESDYLTQRNLQAQKN
jgi:hypothetical protein